MSAYLTEFLGLMAVFSVLIVAPGADFALVIRQCIVHGRKTALITSVGIGLSLLFHISYTILGIGLIAQDTTGDSIGPWQVTLDQLGKSPPVAVRYHGHQGFIARRLRHQMSALIDNRRLQACFCDPDAFAASVGASACALPG